MIPFLNYNNEIVGGSTDVFLNNSKPLIVRVVLFIILQNTV